MPTSNPHRALNSDPLRSFKFNVLIPLTIPGSFSGTTGMARLGFMSVSGLGISIEPLTYREGGDNLTTRKMPGQADFNPITLSRGEFPGDADNWAWMLNIFNVLYGSSQGAPNAPLQQTSPLTGPDFRTNMYINVLEHPNTTAGVQGGISYESSYPSQNSIIQLSFKLYSAWIGSLAYSDLDAGGNAVGIEQMTLNYEGFELAFGNPYVAFGSSGW